MSTTRQWTVDCPTPGANVITSWVNCGACDDGHVDLSLSDDINFSPGDWLRCSECDGVGGWHICAFCADEEEAA